jgi:Ca-activated chloride channel family protein
LRGRELVDAARERRGALHAAADNLRNASPDRADAAGAYRIVLLTDGLANVGITDPAVLVRLCAVARAAGVTTTTVGFGPGYDERLLRAMADAGGGNSYYVERPDQAADVFAEEVEGLLAIGAQNVRVDVRTVGAGATGGAGLHVVAVRVHHDWPGERTSTTRASSSATCTRASRSPCSSSGWWPPPTTRRRTPGRPRDPSPSSSCTRTACRAGGGVERVTLTLPVAVGGTIGAEPAIVREVLLLEAARAREVAVRAREQGDYAGGAAALQGAARALAEASAGPGCAAPVVAELADESADLLAMAKVFDGQQVSSADAKYLGQMAYANQRGKARSKGRLRRQ